MLKMMIFIFLQTSSEFLLLVKCDGARDQIYERLLNLNRLPEIMKLRKEAADEILEDSLEYKAAVKTVIRYEIQNLVSPLKPMHSHIGLVGKFWSVKF